MTADSRPAFGKVALLGIGLIGSSLAHAMRRAGLAAHISGYANQTETLEKARAIGFADTLHDKPGPAARDADLVVLATPVGAFGELAKEIAGDLKRGAILSDVGSVAPVTVCRHFNSHAVHGLSSMTVLLYDPSRCTQAAAALLGYLLQ